MHTRPDLVPNHHGLYNEEIDKQSSVPYGIRWQTRKLSDLDFVDDIVMMNNSPDAPYELRGSNTP